MMIHFKTRLEKFNSNLWSYHFMVPDDVALQIIEGKDRRVVCKLNEKQEFQCALMPRGGGGYFINVNKKTRDQLKLQAGSELDVTIWKDRSEYGLPMPEELKELFNLDDEGSALFHALTPGKQRTLLYWIGQPKSTDLRITRALQTVEHLKMNSGKVNYRVLMRPNAEK